MYAKLQNCIQLSLTLTKLCHIKCDHLLNFYILLEKREKSRYVCNSWTDLHKVWCDDDERVSLVRCPLKIFILKIQDGGRPIRLRDPFCIIMRYCNLSIFKMAAVHHPGILKLKFLTGNCFRDTFCVIVLMFVEIRRNVADISHFFVFFQVNCKNSLDGRA